jgi:hypothetical protein
MKSNEESPSVSSQLDNSSRKKSRKSSKNLIKSYKQRQFEDECLHVEEGEEEEVHREANNNDIIDDESQNNDSFHIDENDGFNNEAEETNDSE